MDEIAATNQDQALVSLSNARIALASCRTAMEAKKITDAMEAARVYLERTKASAEAVNEATEIRILAERQMGEFLQAMPKAEGVRLDGRDVDGASVVTHLNRRERLEDLKITKNQSSRAQKLAEVPREELQLRMDEVKAKGEKLSTGKVLAEPKPKPRPVTPLPDIVAEMYEAAKLVKVEPGQRESATKKAMLKVLSRYLPSWVGAVTDKPATVDEVYQAYPRHVASAAAKKAITNAMLRHKLSADALLQTTVAYAGAVSKWSESDRQYIPHGATWFNRDSFLDDQKEWARDRSGKSTPKKGAHDL